jgi:hypothetical protein
VGTYDLTMTRLTSIFAELRAVGPEGEPFHRGATGRGTELPNPIS